MGSFSKHAAAGLVAVAFLVLTANAGSAQAPKRGGFLTIANHATLPTLDCHAVGSSVNMQDLGPAYSTLVRFDPEKYPEMTSDLADSWTVSADRLTYTFKLHPDVRFHDGSAFTSADIKATLDRLRNPPPGVTSLRKVLYDAVSGVDTPDPLTVVVHLSRHDPAIMLAFGSPYGCVYSAAQLAKDPKYPETHVMGTGPFKFKEFVPGASISMVRNDDYFVKGLPYLDGWKGVFMGDPAFQNALEGAQVDGAWSSVGPSMIDGIKAKRGDKIAFQEISQAVTVFVGTNTAKGPTADARVRQAMNISIDRVTTEPLLRKVGNNRGLGLLFSAGVAYDYSDSEITKFAGYGPDVAASRAEAKRLLDQAGAHDLKLAMVSRSTEPFASLNVIIPDQMRQIGIAVAPRILDVGPYYVALTAGNFDLYIDANPTTSTDPSEVLAKYLPGSGINYNAVVDPMLQEIYDKQAVETDPAKRRALVQAFEKRVWDQAYVMPLYRSVNIAAVPAELRGWKITPSYAVNTDMRSVWLDK